MAKKYNYNGVVYNSLKEIAQAIGISRVRPKNFTKYGITEANDAEQTANMVVVGEVKDVPSTTYNSEGDVWFHDPPTRAELVGQYGESFNKRAFVTTVEEGDQLIKYLVSFGGVVAKVTEDMVVSEGCEKGKVAKVYGTYSGKTFEHIKAFLLNEGFTVTGVTQVREDYM